MLLHKLRVEGEEIVFGGHCAVSVLISENEKWAENVLLHPADYESAVFYLLRIFSMALPFASSSTSLSR